MIRIWKESIRKLFGVSERQAQHFLIPEKQKEYVVRVNNANGRSPYLNRLIYPATGYVEMPGYRPGISLNKFTRTDDGMGLYGLWRGCGHPVRMLQFAEADSLYCLIEVRKDEVVKIHGGREAKFPRGNILYTGELPVILDHLRRLATTPEHQFGTTILNYYYKLFVECSCDRHIFFHELKKRNLGYNQVQMGIDIVDKGWRWVRTQDGDLTMDLFSALNVGFNEYL